MAELFTSKVSQRYSPEAHERRKAQAREHAYDRRQESMAYRRKNWARCLASRLGISEEEYEAMVLDQWNLCAVCRRPETARRTGRVKRLGVDHDHVTGEIRDLLCQACNTLIGQSGEDPDLLRAAADYLEAHRA